MRGRILRTLCAGIVALAILSQPGFAQRTPMIRNLIELLRIEETVTIMQQEGVAYGDELADQLVPDVNRDSWSSTIERVYDADRMLVLITDGFEAELGSHDIAPILDYLLRDDVREIVSLEISARRAFLDPDTESAAKARFAQMKRQGGPLVERVKTIISDSDLVETNVAGALNADLMFYRGLVEAGAFEMRETEILSEVWENEEALRNSSREWLEAFLMLAYEPVDPNVLDAYAAFWRTAEGKLLNRVLFAAFDEMYEDVSYRLGLAVGREMTSEEL